MTLKSLRPDTAGQPRSRRGRARGIGARLSLSGSARVHLVSATLTYRAGGKARTAKLRAARLSGGKQLKVRLRLHGRLATKLDLGTRVTLALKVRARMDKAGCSYGSTKSFRIRTKLIWVSTRSAI